MADETELKLEVTPEAITALLASDLFREQPAIAQQHSTYFDTPTHELRAAGFSLRIRTVDEIRTQTVKATTSGTVGLFARPEWEFVVDGDQPVLNYTTPLRAEFGSALNALSPVFEVQVERRKLKLIENGSEIEAVLDTGFVAAGDRRSAICEVELELKDGEPQALFALGRKIGGIVPFRLGVLSKSERGYRLLGPMPAVFKAEPVELDHRMNTVSSFQKIAQESLRHFCLNETILLGRQNSEALHQARVALRRLRSAFSIYKRILTDDEADRLRNEMKWLASVLGDARNIDVLVAKVSDNDLRRRLTDARTKAYADADLALKSPRARALMLDICEWHSCGEYLRAPSTEDMRSTPASDFASAALDLQRKKIKKHGRDLAEADDEHRHQVRKDAKKLRYAGDFFGSLFDNRNSRRRHRGFIKVMETLQDQLGVLNDLAMRPQVLEKLGIEDNGSLEDATDKAESLKAVEAALADLLEAKRFWR